jgi:hypothetical protein
MTNGTRRGWGFSVTPRPLFTPGKDPVPIVQRAGWAPGPVWAGAENLALTGIWSPDSPARSQSLYRIRYPVHGLRTKPREIICVAGWTLRRSGSNRDINPDETSEGYRENTSGPVTDYYCYAHYRFLILSLWIIYFPITTWYTSNFSGIILKCPRHIFSCWYTENILKFNIGIFIIYLHIKYLAPATHYLGT